MRKHLLTLLVAAFASTAFGQSYVSISAINNVSASDLAACNDTSAYLGQTIITRGVVVTPGWATEVASGSVTGGLRPFIFIQDTAVGGQSSPWAGIEVMGVYSASNGSLQVPSTFTQVLPGDIVEVKGLVGEYNGSNQLSLVDANSFSIISTTTDPVISDTISLGDLNDNQQVNQLTTGEQYEGSFVTLENLTVTTVIQFSGNRVSFNVADANGNVINVSDRFLAQKLSSYSTVNPNSPQSQGSFVPPVPGTFLNSLSGVVRHDANGCTGDNGRGYEINPFDSTHYDVGYAPPYIANFERDPSVPTSNQDVEIICNITDYDGTVDSVCIAWTADNAVSIANMPKYTFPLSAGTTDEYEYEIPAQTDGSTVRYYIYAADNDGNESWYPTKPTTQTSPNIEFYTVRDNGMLVYDIQYTMDPFGDSPLETQEVTVKGVVTASTKIGDLGYLYIQDETGSAWSGIWCVGIGLNQFYRNEEVEVTGVVEEYYGMTRLNVTSANKTGNLGNVSATVLDPSDSASYANFGWEPYESMFIRYEQPNGKLHISQTNLGFGDFAVSSSNTAAVSHSGRVLAGRQSTTAYSSLDVQLVTDTSYSSLDGEMNVTPIVVSDTMTFDAIEGILFYGFSNYRLVPRNNNDFIGANVTLDSITVANSPISVVELGQMNVAYYPNPVNHQLTVKAPVEGRLAIYNSAGKRVYGERFSQESNVDVSALPNGLYLLSLEGSTGQFFTRISVQH